MAKQDIVVIGGSTGSGPVLAKILSQLSPESCASFFISTHVPSASDYLGDALSRVSAIPVIVPVDGQPIEAGRVYVGVADHHLLLIDGVLRLGDGPRENMVRPSIDPMFRSAAISYGPRVVGVVLSGMLNDGASGLSAIKSCGGTAIVQHPLDAIADEMPLAALETVDVDAVAAGDDLARVLTETTEQDAGPLVQCSDTLVLEVEIAGGRRLGSEALREFADPSALTCPDCQGVLSEIRDQKPLRYRCQIGHAQTAQVLSSERSGVDDALRVALRVMEERVTLVNRMAKDARESGRTAVAELYEQRGDEFSRYAQILREAAVESLRENWRIKADDR